MDFIQNFNKEFLLADGCKMPLTSPISYISKGCKVKIHNINMEEITFRVSSVKDMKTLVSEIQVELIKELQEDFVIIERGMNKVIKAWDTKPENFQKQQKSLPIKETYVNQSLLTEKEYMTFGIVLLGKFSSHFGYGFATGWGGKTYYPKDYYVKGLAECKPWLDKHIKMIDSKEFRVKIENQIKKENISFSYKDVLKYISIPKSS